MEAILYCSPIHMENQQSCISVTVLRRRIYSHSLNETHINFIITILQLLQLSSPVSQMELVRYG
jgi:hypothetical protein